MSFGPLLLLFAAVTPGEEPVLLNDSMEVLFDVAPDATVEDVRTATFTPARGRLELTSEKTKVTWARVVVENPKPEPERVVLMCELRDLTSFTAYVPGADGGYQAHRVGWLTPLYERDLFAGPLALELELPPRQRFVMYLRFESWAAIYAPVTLWLESMMPMRVGIELLFVGFFGGFLFALAAYHALLFFRLRLGYLLHYALGVTFFAAWWLSHAGYLALAPVPDAAIYLPPLFTVLWWFFRIAFVRSFFEAKRTMPRADRVLLAMQWGFVPLSLVLGIVEPMMTLASVAVFGFSLAALRHRLPMAGFVSVATGLMAVGLVLSALAFTGVLEVPFPAMGAPVIFAADAELVLIALVLSERIRASAREKEAALLQLQGARLDTMQTVVAGMMHELNSPVGALGASADGIQRASEILADETAEPNRVGRAKTLLPQMVGSIRDAAERIRVVLQTLGAFARLDATERSQVDVRESLDAALLVVSKQLRDGVSIERRFADEDLEVRGRSGDLNLAFMAILKNAAEATEEGTISVTAARENDTVAVTVGDTGPGIPEAALRTIFEPRFSKSGARVRMGLGIATARSVVDAHSGELTIDSEIGRGTKVSIRLPRVDAEQASLPG